MRGRCGRDGGVALGAAHAVDEQAGGVRARGEAVRLGVGVLGVQLRDGGGHEGGGRGGRGGGGRGRVHDDRRLGEAGKETHRCGRGGRLVGGTRMGMEEGGGKEVGREGVGRVGRGGIRAGERGV